MSAFLAESARTIRNWRHRKASVAMLVLCSAVGFGANVVVLGVSDQLIFGAPAGVRAAESLVRLSLIERQPGNVEAQTGLFSYPAFRFLEAGSTQSSRFGAYAVSFLDVEVGEDVRREQVAFVSEGYFEALGVAATAGALPSGATAADWRDDRAIVSERFAARFAGTAAQALGRIIRLSDRPFTVVAVTKGGFTGIDVERTDVWLPIESWAPQLAGAAWRSDRSAFWLTVIARMNTGVTGEQLGAQLTGIVRGSTVVRAADRSVLRAEPMTSAYGAAQRRLQLLAVVLSAVSILILVASSVNVASVLLGRVIDRDREFAVRLAVGATRRSLLSLIVAEGAPLLLLALLAGGVGALAAARSIGEIALPQIAWPEQILSPRIVVATLVLFAIALVITVAVPTWQAQRTRLAAVLSSEGGGSTRRSSRLWAFLLSAQLACTVVLLFGAVTFSALLARLEGEDLGFDARHAGVIDFAASGRADTAIANAEVLSGLLPRLARLPGVQSVGLGADVPLRRSTGTMMEVLGTGPVEPLETGGPYVNAIDNGAVQALGLVLRRGRLLDETDRLGSLPAMLVTETFARVAFKGKDALGGCVKTLFDASCRTVVGVVQDVRRENVLEPATLQVFIPISQVMKGMPPQAIFLRTIGSPLELRPMIRGELARSGIPPTAYRYDALGSLVEPELTSWRLAASVFVVYAVFALVVAITGTLGMLALDVARRRREFAIRVILGARFKHVLAQLGSSMLWWVLIGISFGLVVWVIAWRQLGLLVVGMPRSAIGTAALQTVGILVFTVFAVALVTARDAWTTPPGRAIRD